MTRTDFEITFYPAGIPQRQVHPGRTIRSELLARRTSVHQAALPMRVEPNWLSLNLNGTCGPSADTALRLVRFFRNGWQFWMNLRAQHDLALVARTHGAQIEAEVTPAAA